MTPPRGSRPAADGEGADARPRACPLCSGTEVREVERIPVESLRQLYVALLGPGALDEFAAAPEALELLECGSCRLRHFAPALEGSPRLYELLRAFPWYYEPSKPEFGTVARHLPPSARVLEIGCGAGYFRQHVPGCTYVGLETSPAARSQAVARGVDVRSDSVEQHAVRFPRGYDAVVALQVLEHVATPRAFLTAAARCLAPGGVLAISVPSFEGYLRGARNYTLNLPPHHQTLWPDEAVRAIGAVLGAGLVALVHEPLRPIHAAEYRRFRIEHVLDRMRGAGGRAVDLSRGAQICTRLAGTLGRVLGSPRPGPRTVGHSVVAVFRMGDRP